MGPWIRPSDRCQRRSASVASGPPHRLSTSIIKVMKSKDSPARSCRRFFLIPILTVLGMSVSSAAEPSHSHTFLDLRNDALNLRVMSWNVWRDSIFAIEGKRRDSFERIVKAVRPDVVCLQEVNSTNASKLSGIMDRLLPLENHTHWQVHSAPNTDNMVASRYPLRRRKHEYVVPAPTTIHPGFHRGQIMCLVDLPDSLGVPDVYIIAAHFPSQRNINGRQRQADSIVRHLRRLHLGSDPEALANGTPILILGDLNVYASEPDDAAHHLTPLLPGNIIDEAEFGADMAPDWDGSYLAEVKPRHNSREKDWYTWRVDDDRFAPGALDRIIFTDSVLEVRSSFVLNTTTLSENELRQGGMLATDVLRSAKPGDFDHLPLVADFAFIAESQRNDDK